MKKSRQIKRKKNTIKNIEQKTKDEECDPKTKMMLEFAQKTACSLTCSAIKKTSEVQPTTRLFNEQMFMFVKISLFSFIFDLLKTFCFPNEKTKAIYEKYMIEIIIPFHVLTDSDSTCMLFLFLCKSESTFPDSAYWDCLFEVILASEIYHRFNTLHKFCDRFSARNGSLEKELGYYKIDNHKTINNDWLMTVAVNLKENIEKLRGKI